MAAAVALTPGAVPSRLLCRPRLREDGSVPIGSVEHRERVLLSGRIRAMLGLPLVGHSPPSRCTLADDGGGIVGDFLGGRREVPGINVGVRLLRAQGVGEYHSQPGSSPT